MLNKYVDRDTLVEFVTKNSDILLQRGGIDLHHAWCIAGKLPISISEYEFNHMKEFIVNHNLKNGFELGTGIGISTLAIGYALKQNGGNLLTVDSYIEDNAQVQYIKDNIKVKETSLTGPDKVKKLLNLFNLDNVTQVVGWSPVDCIKSLRSLPKIDFVFIDCPKCDEDFQRDISYLPEFLAERFVIFVHDSHTFTKKSDELVRTLFNKPLERINKFNPPQGIIIQNFPLAIINNL